VFSVASNRRSLSVAGLAFATLTALSGCATLQPEDSEKWRESQRPVLIERAEARWNALIKGDIEKAYTFTTPDYRAVVSAQQYRGKYGRVADWRVARVVNVSYDVPTVAAVSVEVTYRVGIPGAGGELIETQKSISEKWIYKDREWWYIAN
jgi:hypothetical protein